MKRHTVDYSSWTPPWKGVERAVGATFERPVTTEAPRPLMEYSEAHGIEPILLKAAEKVKQRMK